MRMAEKSQVKGKGSSNRPCCWEDIPKSIQTHVLPDVGKPEPKAKTPWLRTGDVS